MTRKSKREIARALEDLDGAAADEPASRGPELEKCYPSAVVEFIYGVGRDLFGIQIHSDEIPNERSPEATAAFLATVRDRYAIDTDRDDAVRRVLEEASEGMDHWGPVDSFTAAPMAVAARHELTAADGSTLTDLVDSERDVEAERLLVRTAYQVLAEEDGGQEVVA